MGVPIVAAKSKQLSFVKSVVPDPVEDEIPVGGAVTTSRVVVL